MASWMTLLERVIDPAKDDLSSELAQYFLSLDFSKADHSRYADLAARAQDGSLTFEERTELEDFLKVNDFLTIVQSKARATLNRRSPAA